MIEQLLKYSTAKLTQTLPTYKRFLFDKIDFSSKLIGIIGARGAGKTTLALQYLRGLEISSDAYLYISCDHPLIASKTLLEIAEEFASYGGEVLVIDEIHKKENFCIELKNIYDFIDIQVVFTGSSAIALEQCQSDLSRRALIYRLPELSLREFIELSTNQSFESVTLEEILTNHHTLSTQIMQKIKPLKYYRDYILYGAYPIFLEGKKSYLQRLIEIINETLISDIATIYRVPIQNISSLHRLLEVICRSNPYEINYEKISSASSISKNTLKNYLRYLEQASLLRVVGGMARGNTYIAKPEKIYLHNTNLMSVLCTKSEVGTLRETFFASMLQYQHSLHYPKQGDFQVDEKYYFEIGGGNKKFTQIKSIKDSFVVKDKIESGFRNSIPLWLFGFLY